MSQNLAPVPALPPPPSDSAFGGRPRSFAGASPAVAAPVENAPPPPPVKYKPINDRLYLSAVVRLTGAFLTGTHYDPGEVEHARISAELLAQELDTDQTVGENLYRRMFTDVLLPAVHVASNGKIRRITVPDDETVYTSDGRARREETKLAPKRILSLASQHRDATKRPGEQAMPVAWLSLRSDAQTHGLKANGAGPIREGAANYDPGPRDTWAETLGKRGEAMLKRIYRDDKSLTSEAQEPIMALDKQLALDVACMTIASAGADMTGASFAEAREIMRNALDEAHAAHKRHFDEPIPTLEEAVADVATMLENATVSGDSADDAASDPA